MSTQPSTSSRDDTDDTERQLTDEERATFERLADRYEHGDVGQICEAVLQSDSDPDSEEASS